MMRWYEDADGNFVEQFQTTGFDAKVWELYLFATLSEVGYVIDRPHPAPDFTVRGPTGKFRLEVHTNNSSYGRSPASEQHLALDQMRAAELGVPVARAAITGVSALIDSRGEVVTRMELYETGTAIGNVSLSEGTTLYERIGDWILSLPLTILTGFRLSAVAIAFVRRRGAGSVVDAT